MSQALPSTPLRGTREARIQASRLLKDARSTDVATRTAALERLRQHPYFNTKSMAVLLSPKTRVQLKHAQHTVALEWGFDSWKNLLDSMAAIFARTDSIGVGAQPDEAIFRVTRPHSNLPVGHVWREISCDSGHGVDYLWECDSCGASFYMNIDQGLTTTEFTEGNEPCGDDISDLRGAYADGYTDDDVDETCRRVSGWCGVTIGCVWAAEDVHGLGGDSEHYAIVNTPDGIRLGALPKGMWEFLVDKENGVDPESFRDVREIKLEALASPPSPPVPFQVGDYNYAWKDET